MKILNTPTRSRSAKFIQGIAAGLSVFLCSASVSSAAAQVDVFLTGLKFGADIPIHATSKTKTINAAAKYSYELSGVVRGTPGTPLAKVVKIGTPISTFVEFVSPGGSSFLKGTFTNPNGTTLPATVLNKKFAGTKKINGVPVKISFTVVGSILADGQCVLDVTDVKFKSTPATNLGSITFSKGSKLNIKVIP